MNREYFISLFKKHYLLLVIYLLLITIFYRWFGPGLFANNDIPYLSIENIKTVYTPYLWKNFHDLGAFYTEIPYILISYFTSIPSLLFNLPYNAFTLKVSIFYPYLFFAPLGAYLLVYKLTKNSIASAFAALIYTINTPILMALAQGHTYQIPPKAFLPFVFLFSILYFEKKNRILSLAIVNLLLVIISLYEVRLLYLTFIWVSMLVFYELIYNKFKNIKACLVFFSSLLLTAIAFNAYWLLPSFFSTASLQSNAILNRPLFGQEFVTLLNPLLFFHPYWTSKEIAIFTSQSIPVIFFILPVFALLGFLFNNKNKYAIFFMLLLFVGLTLGKGTNEPFNLYQLLYDYLPGFKLFREPTKFFEIIGLSYAVLIGYFINSLYSLHKKRIIILSIIFSLIGIYLFTLAKPIVTGEAKTIFIPIQIEDQDYGKLRQYLQTENDHFFRVLWIPRNSSLGILKNSMPNVNLTGVLELWNPILKEKKVAPVKNASDFFTQKYVDTLLDVSAIRYVVLTKKYTSVDGNLYYWYEKKEDFERKLSKIKYLKKIKDYGEIVVYENTDYRPHFYLTKTKETISHYIPYSPVRFQYINPTKYTVSLENISKKTYLNFSELYDTNWQVILGKESIIFKNNNYPEQYHIQNEAKLNSFLIDPEYIQENYSHDLYTINPDGSINLEITLIYKPQLYFSIGLLISFVTVIFILTIIIVQLTRFKHKNE